MAKFFSLSLSLFISSPLWGQFVNPFLHEIDLESADFTISEEDAWDALEQDPATLSIKLVEIGDLSDYLSGDELMIRIPGNNDTLYLRGLYLQQSGDTSYTWWGEFPDAKGYLGMSANGAGKLLYLSSPTERYMLHPISGRYNVQVELRPEAVTKHCPRDEFNADSIPTCPYDTCKSTLSVLVLVTPEAIEEMTPLLAHPSHAPLYLALGMQTINFALLNSSVIGKSFRFITEGYDGFEYDLNNDIFTDIATLEGDNYALDRWAANHADAMILLTNDRYENFTGIESIQPGLSFAIVTMRNMFAPRFTFAHEIGHMLDAQHSREAQGGNIANDWEGCNTGYRATLPGPLYIYTIMAIIDDEEIESRVLYFSNPNISILGESLGNAKSYNAAYITGHICEEADRYFAEDELKIDITGPAPECHQSDTYTIDIDPPGTGIPGNSPYTYKWYLGSSPYISPLSGALIGNTSSVTINPSNIPSEKYWLYVSVHSADGVMANDLLEFENPCAEPESDPLSTLTKNADFAFDCFPNPTQNYLSLAFHAEVGVGSSQYVIVNLLGQAMQSGILQMENNGRQTRLFFDLEPGLYALQIRLGSGTVSRKFMVQR